MTETTEKAFFSKVSLNMVTNILRVVIMAIVGLVMVPYYIKELGLSTYALIPLVTSITTYVLVASESLSESFTRFMILSMHGKDKEETNRIYSSSVTGMFRVILIIMPILVLISILSPYIFNVGTNVYSDVQMMFLMVLIASLMISFTTCFDSVYMAHNCLYVLYSMKAIYTIFQVLLVIGFFILWGPSLTLIGVSFFISAIIFVICLFIGTRFIDPELKIKFSLYDKNLLKEMISPGMWNLASRFGNIMFIQASQIIVNICLNSKIQGEFSIVANIISMITTVSTALVAVGVPLLYKCYNNGDKKTLITTLGLFTRFSGLMLTFPIAYVCVFTPQVLTVWLGTTYENTVLLIRIMTPICVAKCSMDILGSVAILYNDVKTMGIWTLILGTLNVGLSIVFIKIINLGVIGACIAWGIGIGLLNIVFYPLFMSGLIKINMKVFVKPLVINYLAFLILIGLGVLYENSIGLDYGWVSLIISLSVGFAVFFMVIMGIGLNREERKMVVTYLPQSMQRFISK